MTRPVPWRRTDARTRRRQRADFAAVKQHAAENPSPETLKARTKNRRDNERHRASAKFRKAKQGAAIRPFSSYEIGRLRPDELGQLREEVTNRLGQLTAAEREGWRAHSWLMVLSFSTEQLKAIAGDRLSEGPA